MDITLQILQLIGYILLLVVLALLWRKAFLPAEYRQFWTVLALAWTLNLLGNIAWAIHDLVTGTPLDTFTGIDLLYVLQYVSIGYALWLYPVSLSRQVWFWVGGAMLAMNVAVWLIYSNRAITPGGMDWVSFLGVAVYPALDAGIVTLAWSRVRLARGSAWRRYAFLMFYAMASYGIANIINLTESVFSPISGGILPHVFWVLTDVFLLWIAVGVDLREEKAQVG